MYIYDNRFEVICDSSREHETFDPYSICKFYLLYKCMTSDIILLKPFSTITIIFIDSWSTDRGQIYVYFVYLLIEIRKA